MKKYITSFAQKLGISVTLLVMGALGGTAVVAYGATCTGTNFGGTGICYPTTITNGAVLQGNSSGGFTQTTSPSFSGFTATGPITNANGNVLATGPIYRVSTTTNTGDFTSITAALAALPSGGGTIEVTCGTFSIPAGISWTYSNTVLEGQGDCTQINIGAGAVGIYMGDTTQRSLNHIRNFKINENGSAGTGTCVDFSYFAISTFDYVDCSNANIGYIASTTGSLYDSITYPRISVSGVGSVGYEVTNAANFNLLKKPRILTDANSTGILINAHDNMVEEGNVETGALIGVDIGANGGEANLPGLYLEANQTNLRLASGVRGVFITGFVADATVADLTDNGATNFSFVGNLSNVGRAFTKGNYGFGTTTPQNPLVIQSSTTGLSTFLNLVSPLGQASEEPAIDIGNLATSQRTFARISATGGSGLANDFLKFWVDNGSGTITTRMVIDHNGNVGIATTSPTYPLSVEGTSSLGNQAIAGSFTATSTATSTLPSINITNCLNYSGVCNSPYWIAPYQGGFTISATSQTLTQNAFVNAEFEVDQPMSIDQVCYTVGGTQSGNVQMAIYGPTVTRDSIVGAPFIASTTSTAQGTTNQGQCLSITTPTLQPGNYYVGLQGDNGTGTFLRQSNSNTVTGWSGTFSTAYGALPTATATTTTNTSSAIPGFRIRVLKPN